jgi:tetratricopeptide (TPR) repeat protein
MRKYCNAILILLMGSSLASCQGIVDPKVLYKHAYDKARAKSFRSAIDDLDKAIAIDSTYADAYLLRGVIKVSLGENEAACKDARKAADLGNQQAVQVCEQYCQVFSEDQIAGRIRPEDSLSKLYPGRPEPYYNIGNIYFDAKQYKKAIEYCDKAILADSSYAPAYYNKGACLLNLHEYGKGCKFIYKAAGMGYDLAIKLKSSCDAELKGNHEN